MWILAIETSSPRGSVALVADGQVAAYEYHSVPNAHAERILPMVHRVCQVAGCPKDRLCRIAVGTGPGSFTGLRVGLALAQGIALGLGIEVVGVGSLRAMASAVPADIRGNRLCLLDARRGEVFCAAYDVEDHELIAPRTVGLEELSSLLDASIGDQAGNGPVVVGQDADRLLQKAGASGAARCFRSHDSDLPDARPVGLLAATSARLGPPVPEYVRDADAKLPNLPASPLDANPCDRGCDL